MLIFENIEQRSEEWFELRNGAISGSRAGKIYPRRASAKFKDEFYEVLAERVARPLTPNDYVDLLDGRSFSEMARGEILEPQALDAFRAWYRENVNPEISDDQIIAGRFWISADDERMVLSPDGEILGEDSKIVEEAVEIKCLKSSKILRAYAEQQFPDEFREQCLMYFLVNPNLKKLYRVLYTDLIPKLECQVFAVSRDEVEADLSKMREYLAGVSDRLNALTLELSDF